MAFPVRFFTKICAPLRRRRTGWEGGSLLLDSETVQQSWSCSPAKMTHFWSGKRLDLRLDVVNGVRRPDLKSDGLSGVFLYKDLHTTTETKDGVDGRPFWIKRVRPALELLTRRNEMWLTRAQEETPLVVNAPPGGVEDLIGQEAYRGCQATLQRRLDAADRDECCKPMSARSMQSTSRFGCLHGDTEHGTASTPPGCSNPKECIRPQTACQQR